MITVIGIGAIYTAIVYLLGFLGAVYVIDKIIVSLNSFLLILNKNIPPINGFSIQIFFLFLIGSVIVFFSNGDVKQHTNVNNEIVYRKEWQKLLDIINVAMVYPIFNFFKNTYYIGQEQKIIMIVYAVLFLSVFVISHYYTYGNL